MPDTRDRPLSDAEIHKAKAEVVMTAWDAVPSDFRSRCAQAEAGRDIERHVYCDNPGVVRDFLFMLDVADEFERNLRFGRWSVKDALTLAMMETRVTWARLARDKKRRAA